MLEMRFPTIPILSNCNVRLKELSSNGKWQELLCHHHEIQKSGLKLTDPSAFLPILKACSTLRFSAFGKAVHGGLIKTGFESCTSVANSTMDFYVKTGELGSALCVFNGMRSRDGVSWNIVVCGCLDQGDLEQGLWWFNNSRVYADGFQFQPNNSTLVLVIQACRRLRDECEGLIVHGYVIRGGFCFVSSVQNSLLSLYAEEGDMDSAQNVFDEMRERDVISWSVMIGGFVRCEEALIGMQMFRRMVAELGIEPDGVTMVSVLKACTNLRDLTMGQSIHGLVICRGLDCDIFVGNSLIDIYSKCSDADSAFKIFEAMPQRNKVSWNSILSGFVFNEKHLEALSLFFSMRNEGIEADEVTLVNVLQTSEDLGLIHCKSVHCVTIRQGYESNELLLNSLMDAYAKCNDVELAWKLFRGMKKRDVVSWSNMIGGFASCGRPDEAIAVFNEMMRLQGQDQKPNEITIINLFDACSASAELKRSKWAHGIAIRRGMAAQVAVGTAIVDMYSKCGAIGESRKAFGQILEKNVVSWSAMIAAQTYVGCSIVYYSISITVQHNKRGNNNFFNFELCSFLDKAAVETQSDKIKGSAVSWRLCTVTQVEELKSLTRLLPIWATGIIFSAVYSQMGTLFVLQGNTMDFHVSKSFEIPSASLSLFDTIVYDRVIVPFVRKFTGRNSGFTQLQMMNSKRQIVSNIKVLRNNGKIAEVLVVVVVETWKGSGLILFAVKQ